MTLRKNNRNRVEEGSATQLHLPSLGLPSKHLFTENIHESFPSRESQIWKSKIPTAAMNRTT